MADRDALRSLVVETVTMLLRNSLPCKEELQIQGLLGITVDKADVFIIHINERFPEYSISSQGVVKRFNPPSAMPNSVAINVKSTPAAPWPPAPSQKVLSQLKSTNRRAPIISRRPIGSLGVRGGASRRGGDTVRVMLQAARSTAQPQQHKVTSSQGHTSLSVLEQSTLTSRDNLPASRYPSAKTEPGDDCVMEVDAVRAGNNQLSKWTRSSFSAQRASRAQAGNTICLSDDEDDNTGRDARGSCHQSEQKFSVNREFPDLNSIVQNAISQARGVANQGPFSEPQPLHEAVLPIIEVKPVIIQPCQSPTTMSPITTSSNDGTWAAQEHSSFPVTREPNGKMMMSPMKITQGQSVGSFPTTPSTPQHNFSPPRASVSSPNRYPPQTATQTSTHFLNFSNTVLPRSISADPSALVSSSPSVPWSSTIKYICGICQHDFTTKRAMQHHQRTIHDITPSSGDSGNESMPAPWSSSVKFICGICQNEFTTKRAMQHHQRTIHGVGTSGVESNLTRFCDGQDTGSFGSSSAVKYDDEDGD